MTSLKEPEGITYETATSASSKAGEPSFYQRKVTQPETSPSGLDRRQSGDGCVVPVTDVDWIGSFKKQNEKDAQRGIYQSRCPSRAEHTLGDTPTQHRCGSAAVGAFARPEGFNFKGLLKKIVSFPFLALIWIYRNFVSPLFPSSCIYTPTCSKYSFEAISKYGPIKGIWLSIKRIIRCRPGMPGGYDPVP